MHASATKLAASFELLADVSRGLAGSLDYETTAAAVARLALPYLGSWCALDVQEDGGAMRRIAVIHPDPAKQSLARELENGWPPDRDVPFGMPTVMSTRRTEVNHRVDDALLVQVASTAKTLDALRALGIGSLITVPLIARNEVLGAITFVSSNTGHQYDPDDVPFAEHLAALAALALDNAQLHRSAVGRAEAVAASKAKSEFLAMMSHEIRTPINAILGYTELIELGIAGPVSRQQHEFLARVRLSGTHLVELITEVLDLAKVEAGQLPVLRESAMTGTSVAAAFSLTFPAADAKNIQLVDANAESPASGNGCGYVGDEHRVRQILVNLLTNAVKFTPSGGIVTVSCGKTANTTISINVAGRGPWVFIRVADTGPGIAAQLHAAVFEPFVQGKSGLARATGGTGLGLTISRQLARLMGGDLTLESQPGKGAEFTLWLPSAADAPTDIDGGVTESANERIARALRARTGYRTFGLAEIGTHVRRRVEDVLESVAARLRADPDFLQARDLRRSDLEDHQLAFLADVVQSLVVIDETGGVQSMLYRDGSEIQRVVSNLHGRMRQLQGWTAAQLDRESAIMVEEIQSLIRRHVPEGVGDVTSALEVVGHLVEQGRAIASQAYRQAALEVPAQAPLE